MFYAECEKESERPQIGTLCDCNTLDISLLSFRSFAFKRLRAMSEHHSKYLWMQPHSIGFIVTVENLAEEYRDYLALPADDRDPVADHFFDPSGEFMSSERQMSGNKCGRVGYVCGW